MKDMNERVREEWKGDTTPRERVRSIMRRTYDPQTVSTIAERALVSTEDACKHLDILAEGGFVETVDGGRYRRSPESIVRERAEQILDAVDVDTLEARIEELRATVCEFEAVDGLTGEEMVEWRTTRRNLWIAEAALEFVEEGDGG